ncbi:MAG: transcriptional regulator [Gammaproteobacteria bacterium]|nr:MAG: transcriptional regulator [Gammaproteobacteria bacterium]
MILETGRVVAVEPKGLWVETIQRSACGSCQAQKGCGHSALAKFGASASYLWVLLEGRDSGAYQIGNEVQIGVPEDIIVKGSMFVYMLPLFSMIAATLISHHYLLNDGLMAVSALLGLLLGAIIVRGCSHLIRFDKRLQPVLVDEHSAVQVIEICVLE